MQAKLWKCALAGGLVLFLWGNVSWMLLPFNEMSILTFTSDEPVRQAILANAPKDGMYLLPNQTGANAVTTTGPGMFAAIVRGGPPQSMVPQLAIHLVTQTLCALLMSWLLLQTSISTFGGRLCFVITAAVFLAVADYVPLWNWFGYSWAYTLTQMGDTVAGWFFAGLAIARFSR
jgi:hypothetical protein